MIGAIIITLTIFIAAISLVVIAKLYEKFTNYYEKELTKSVFIFILIATIALSFRLLEATGLFIFTVLFYLTWSKNFIYLFYRLFSLSQSEKGRDDA